MTLKLYVPPAAEEEPLPAGLPLVDELAVVFVRFLATQDPATAAAVRKILDTFLLHAAAQVAARPVDRARVSPRPGGRTVLEVKRGDTDWQSLVGSEQLDGPGAA